MPLQKSDRLEFKKNLSELEEGVLSLGAMLNRHGQGELWFGIASDGTPVGLEVGENTVREIARTIAGQMEPPVFPDVSIVTLDGRDCLKIVCQGQDMPYFARGRACIRVAGADRMLSIRELKNLNRTGRRHTMRWDRRQTQARLEDLDEEKIRSFAEKAGLAWNGPEKILDRLKCLRDGAPVNASLLFFGRKPAARLHCEVCADAYPSAVPDRQDYEGDILSLIEEAQKYILRNIRVGMEPDDPTGEDLPEIAPQAFREAIVNAFCHREYCHPEGIRVAVYRDRVEIRSPGSLYGGLTLNRLRRKCVSRCRNPLVADLLRRIHMAKGRCRGIPLILEKEPSAQFSEIAELFVTTFKRKHIPPAESAFAASQPFSLGGESTAEKILRLIEKAPEITIDSMSSALGLSRGCVRYHVRKLRRMGILSRIGTKRGRWIFQ